MPVHLHIPCPECGKVLYHKREGRCPTCGTPVSGHVEKVRDREEQIEKIVAVIGTGLVLLVLVVFGGFGLLEGIAMYAAAGAAMFYAAKKTFKPNSPNSQGED